MEIGKNLLSTYHFVITAGILPVHCVEDFVKPADLGNKHVKVIKVPEYFLILFGFFPEFCPHKQKSPLYTDEGRQFFIEIDLIFEENRRVSLFVDDEIG